MVALAIHQGRSPSGTVGFQLEGWICLPLSAPTPFNPVFRHRAEVSLPRPRIARADSAGMFTGQSICVAVRLIIRVRLTPGRLTSPGNPWSCGGGGSRPPYRYLCLHLLFQTLHGGSRLPLRRGLECSPTDAIMHPAASARSLIPDYYPCLIPRLVSCYALFE